ncbi:MAG TPA: protein kinase [Nonomuraea sp.]|nr:protein kinase [Nonomuraea sp.]
MVPGYRELRQLGAGHTGRVFLATYQTTGAYVAIKYLNATLRRDPEFMDRFRSDVHRLVEIDDPNVVRVHEYVETSTRAAVVMELVDGVSLRTLLAEHARTTPEAALTVLKGILLALAAAHDKGVPHRDVKPENILVQADGTAKLADFGVVVHAEEPGVPAGSPAYMSPELWTQHRAGPPADLYATACVLFESVKGRPPFRAHKEGKEGKEDTDGELDVPATRDRHLVEPVPVEVVPDALRDLLRRGLAKDPAVRYASARQFAAELEEDALAAYGPDWEKRGRRHLAELATVLALRFPLARADQPSGAAPATLRDRIMSLPRLPPHLWVAGAAVVAVAIALVLSGGRLPPGPGAILMPPPDERSEPAPSPAEATTAPTRTTAPAGPTPTTGGRPAATSQPPPPLPSPTTPPPTPGPGATGGRPVVHAAGIERWSGTSGTIRVSTDGPGPVRLRITYTRRDGADAPARTVREETRTLRGDTAYTRTVTHDPGDVPCGTRSYAGILVMTEPASGNGPQVSEAPVDGPACAPAPSASVPAVPTPTGQRGTPTPEGTGTPVAQPSGDGTLSPLASPPERPDEPPPPTAASLPQVTDIQP